MAAHVRKPLHAPHGAGGAFRCAVRIMGSMPNQSKNTPRNFRIEGEVWDDARRIAEKRGEVISDEIRKFVHQYVNENRALLD